MISFFREETKFERQNIVTEITGRYQMYVNQRVASRDSIISRKNGRNKLDSSCSLLVDSNGRYYVDIRPSRSSRCRRDVACIPTNRQWTMMMYPTRFPFSKRLLEY